MRENRLTWFRMKSRARIRRHMQLRFLWSTVPPDGGTKPRTTLLGDTRGDGESGFWYAASPGAIRMSLLSGGISRNCGGLPFYRKRRSINDCVMKKCDINDTWRKILKRCGTTMMTLFTSFVTCFLGKTPQRVIHWCLSTKPLIHC